MGVDTNTLCMFLSGIGIVECIQSALLAGESSLVSMMKFHVYIHAYTIIEYMHFCFDVCQFVSPLNSQTGTNFISMQSLFNSEKQSTLDTSVYKIEYMQKWTL